VSTIKQALPYGDCGVRIDGSLVASVKRKSLVDLVASLIGGPLRYALASSPPAQGGRRRGPLLGRLQTRPSPTGDDRRRTRRTPDPLAQRADRVLPDPALAEEWTYRDLASLRPEDRSPRDPLPGLPTALLDRHLLGRRVPPVPGAGCGPA